MGKGASQGTWVLGQGSNLPLTGGNAWVGCKGSVCYQEMPVGRGKQFSCWELKSQSKMMHLGFVWFLLLVAGIIWPKLPTNPYVL